MSGVRAVRLTGHYVRPVFSHTHALLWSWRPSERDVARRGLSSSAVGAEATQAAHYLQSAAALPVGGLAPQPMLVHRQRTAPVNPPLAVHHQEVFRPKRIILLRHGESEGNRNDKTYRQTPDNRVPLTNVGELQALRAGMKLRAIIGDEKVKFYVSPYRRTRQTYQCVARAFDDGQYEFREEPRLREQDFGNFQDENIQKHREARKLFGSFYYRFPQGESGADVYDRMSNFIETLHREFARRDCAPNLVLISHGLTSRLFLMRYFHWEVDRFQRTVNLRNCQFVTMLRGDDGRYSLDVPLRESRDVDPVRDVY